MVMSRRWQRVVLELCGAVLTTAWLVASGEAASCGDTAGPLHTRVPCACQDTVVTSTRLRSTDPVVSSVCTSGNALTIGADKIVLDCRGLSIRGGSPGAALTPAAGLRGIFGQRSGVTVKNCSVQVFTNGIELLGHRNHVLGNVTSETLAGILIDGDDNWIAHNRAEHAFAQGLFVTGGHRNVILHNRATKSFDGLVVDGDKHRIKWNVTNENQRTGIDVGGSGNVLVGNEAHRNGDGEGPERGDGFLVEGTGNVLFGNLATHNEAKGFCAVSGNTDGGFNLAHANDQTPQADFDCVFE